MSNEHMGISDGTYSLVESDDPNIFFFYRNDEGIIGDVGRLPMDFYQNWICTKMMKGEIAHVVMNNICFQTSIDGRVIRIVTSEMKDDKPEASENIPQKQNFIKKIFNRIFR